MRAMKKRKGRKILLDILCTWLTALIYKHHKGYSNGCVALDGTARFFTGLKFSVSVTYIASEWKIDTYCIL